MSFSAKEKLHKAASKPKYKIDLSKETNVSEESLADCNDKIISKIKIQGDKVTSFFDGEGCSISISSAEIISETIKDKTIEEAKKILEQFIDFIEEKTNETEENLKLFGLLRLHKSRKKCALLSAKTILKNIEENYD